MRARVVILAVACGLLVACSDSAPSPTPNPNPFLSTPSPFISTEPTPGEPGEPTPEIIPEPTVEEISTPPLPADPSPTSAAPGTVSPPAAIPDGPLTIVALGDSLTEGDADSPGDGGGYPARLQRSINALRPNSTVINLGKSGWDSAQMNEGQLPAALQANPNIALVWIGSNDLWYNGGPEQEAADMARYTNNIDTALRALTGGGARVFIALLDDQSKRPYTTSPNGAGLSPEGVAYMSRLVSAFNAVLVSKAAQYGATTVDFSNTTIFTDPSTLAEDGIHPNPRGYDLIEQKWLEAIRQVLQ